MSYTKEIEFKIPYDNLMSELERAALEKAQSLTDETVESFTEPFMGEIVWERHPDGGFHKMVRCTSEFTYLGRPGVPGLKVNTSLLSPAGQWHPGRRGRA